MMKIVLVLLACLGFILSSVFSAEPDSTVTHLSQAEFLQKVAAADAPIVVDVRSTQEYADGHIAGAVNLPHNEILVNFSLLEEYREQDIVFYCRSGGRVKKVTDALEEKDYIDTEQVFHLQGDMQGWQKAELPVEQ